MIFSFNALLLTELSTGMRTHIHGLIKGFRELEPDGRMVFLVKPGIRRALNLPDWNNARYLEIPLSSFRLGRIIAESFLIPIFESRYKVQASFSPTPYLPLFPRVPSILTCVDFCYKHFPVDYGKMRTWYLRKNFQRSLAKAQGITTTTNKVKKELLSYFGNISAPIEVIPLGVDREYFEMKKCPGHAVREKYGMDGEIILSTGGASQRKNVKTLIAAYSNLPGELKKNHTVVILGPCAESEKYQLLANLSEVDRNRIRFTGFIREDEKLSFFAMAKLFVFPSLDEGFGLPPLEAMAAGLPTLCSDIEVFRENCQQTALYFDPHSAEDLAGRIALLLNDRSLREHYAAQGRIHAGRFSWQNASRQVHAFLQRIALA
ncbi:MAG: glycosyltransferase family 4 protein [bacterium]